MKVVDYKAPNAPEGIDSTETVERSSSLTSISRGEATASSYRRLSIKVGMVLIRSLGGIQMDES